MPKDKAGNFHINSQRAADSDKRSGAPAPAGGASAPSKPEASAHNQTNAGASGGSTTLHDHGDGTFHTEGHDGQAEEHPHIGHALMHMASKHSDGSHMHVHDHGAGHTTHHVQQGGGVEGPHEHQDPEAMKEHVGQVMGGGGGYEEGNESSGWPDTHSLSGM